MATRVVVVPRRHAARRSGWPEFVVGAGLVGALAFTVHGHLPADLNGQKSAKTPAAISAPAVPVSFARQAAVAISFARAQIGDAYVWGGNGPSINGGWDCSGLVTAAWRKAGVTIPRTSYAEWSDLPHVPRSQVQPGDLVLFAGGDGTAAKPGHVGLVIGDGTMIEAYGRGFPVRISTYGTSSSPEGDQDPVGFARP